MLNTFINDLDSKVPKYTFRKFPGTTKLRVVTDIPDRKVAMQRDLERLRKWTNRNLMKSNSGKCLALPFENNLMHQYRLETNSMEAALQRRPWSPGRHQDAHKAPMCPCKKRILPDWIVKKTLPAVWGRGSFPSTQHGWDKVGIWDLILSLPAEAKHGQTMVHPGKGHKDEQELERLFYIREGGKNLIYSV